MSGDDLRPIVDMLLLRPDIRELVLKNVEEMRQLQGEFILKHPPVGIDLQNLVRRVRLGNRRFFRNEDISGLFSSDEIRYMIQLDRYVVNNSTYATRSVPDDVTCTQVDAGGVTVEWQECPNVHQDKIILYVHGGAFYLGSPTTHRAMTIPIGRVSGTKVLSVDYSLVPEHAFSASLEDVIQSYQWLLEQGTSPSDIVIMGDSAGGNLALRLLVQLSQNEGTFPAGAVLISPLTDVTLSSESIRKNGPTDPVLADGGAFLITDFILGDADPKDPVVSPLFADLKGFPPLLFQVSTSEMVYDDSVRFVKKAKETGVDATLQAWENSIHVWHLQDLPETSEAISKIGEFVRNRLGI